MTIEIYIQGNRMELDEPLAFSLTRQINNFGELKDRQATFTNSFEFPKTKNNVEIFNGLGIIGNKSRKQYQNLETRIVVDSVSVVRYGFGILIETSDNYKFNVYDDNIHLFDAIGNKNLSELDLSELNHDLTTTNFVNSFSHTHTDGYIYAISDFGNFNPSEIIINNQLPSLFVRYIWDKIFAEAGFTKDFEPDADLVITPKRGYIAEEDTGSAASISSSKLVIYYDQTYISFQKIEDEVPMVYEPNQTVGHITLSGGKFTVSETRLHFIDIDTEWNYLEGEYLDYLAIRLYKNGVLFTQDEIENPYSSEGIVISKSYQIYLQVGDEIEIRYFVKYYNGINEDQWGNYSVLSTGFSLESNINFYTVLNATGISVNVGTFIGEMKQYDFVKDVMQHYGLLSKKTKDKNEMKFIKAVDLLTDKTNAYDVTGKLVVDSETYDTDFAQKNLFKYQYRNQDSDQFADGILRIDNTTLQAEKVELTRPYHAPEPSEKLMGGLMRYTPFWEAERDDAGNITKWKVLKGKNYIGRVANRNGSFAYKTQTSYPVNYNGQFPVFTFDYLGYQNILDENYKEIQLMLNWNKKLKGKLLLNIFEFDSFDFFRLIYDKYQGSYFYANSLKLTNGKPYADVKLIAVPQDVVNNTVARIGIINEQHLGSGDIVIQLDGSLSRNYVGVEWVIEIPNGADSPKFSDNKIINPTLTIVDDLGNAGDYIVTMYLNPKTTQQTTSKLKFTVI